VAVTGHVSAEDSVELTVKAFLFHANTSALLKVLFSSFLPMNCDHGYVI